MNVHSYQRLEERLSRIDLRLPEHGEHLSEERLAEAIVGYELTEAEMSHLAGCDECVELMVLLSQSIDELSAEEPQLSLLVSPEPTNAKKYPAAVTTMFVFAAACVMAATGVYLAQNPRGGAGEFAGAERPTPAVVSAPKVASQSQVDSAKPTVASLTVGGKESLPEAVIPPPSRKSGTPTTPMPDKVVPGHDADTQRPTANTRAVKETTPRVRDPQRKRPGKAETSTIPRVASGGLKGRDGPVEYDRILVNAEPRGFGQLRLNAQPAARVYIDGKERGWTPIIDLRLQEGPHDVRLVFESPLADKAEDRFRVLIERDTTWSAVRDNRKKDASPTQSPVKPAPTQDR